MDLIPKKARLNDVLWLRQRIEGARDDLIRAQHSLGEARAIQRSAELAIGTALCAFDTIVAIYNRLVVEYEPQKRRK